MSKSSGPNALETARKRLAKTARAYADIVEHDYCFTFNEDSPDYDKIELMRDAAEVELVNQLHIQLHALEELRSSR